MSYSPGEAGGTLLVPSPTHLHRVDTSSALRQLRRSLSRSPSKSPAFRIVTSKSASPSPRSPLSPPARLTPIRSLSANLLSCPSTTPPSPLSAQSRPNARSTRSAPRRLSPMRSSSRSNSSQRSPVRKVLIETQCRGNATPSSSASSSDDIENNLSQENSTIGFKVPEITLAGKDVEMHDGVPAPRPSFTRNEKGIGRFVSFGAKSSPLKRGDDTMNIDHATFGSPAKRRSIHGSSFGPDFNIFDHEASGLGQVDGSSNDDGTNFEVCTSPDSSHACAPQPKRIPSLRKTTLQQRHEKPVFARSKANADLALNFSTPSHFASKGRQRVSLDGNVPSVARESPFSSQGSLPNASVHPLTQQQIGFHSLASQSHPRRHPLSRTISQSSSASGLAEDSPTHVPVRQPERRTVDFSKSLPVGTARPKSYSDDTSSQTSKTGKSFATPENYKLARPLPAAFMSTGLISKRNKNIEGMNPALFTGTANMPDTPCKRPILQEPPTPSIAPFSAINKARQVRHSFGTPSTPFSPHASRVAPGTFGKGASIFGTLTRGGLQRRASFASIDGEDVSQSPSAKHESQSSTDGEVPPTPTKQIFLPNPARAKNDGQNKTKGQDDESDPTIEEVLSSRLPGLDQNCEYSQTGMSIGMVDGDSFSAVKDSPTATLNFKCTTSTPSSFTKSRFPKFSYSPTPLSKKAFHSYSSYSRKFRAKPSPLSPASPISKRIGSLSPRTPSDGMVPPDPSGLSISAHGDGHNLRPSSSSSINPSIRPPATPTASRDSLYRFGNRRSSVTPVHGFATEVDLSLMSRFDKVDLVGTGQFSQVYRVTRKQELKSTQGYFFLPATRTSPKTPLPDRVWAVKKSRHAYIGLKDRQRKLKEVAALKALGQSEHTIQYFDSWEEKNYLYIQTEFCEEGSLDTFLNQAGRQARLDDFRIWKIMLELCLGIKHIHECGYMHLDLKPANILITFEGTLKIADFGMAVTWPAEPGVDGEGDREYIGPEILEGVIDKPADMFALGMIMVEIAGNVMLPDNGVSWQRLRSGDMSDVPSLTWSSEASNIVRDSSGQPVSYDGSTEDVFESDSNSEDFGSPKFLKRRREEQAKTPSTILHLQRSGELVEPPSFMKDPDHGESLDKVVRWMTTPDPTSRPRVDQILETVGVKWVDARKRAGATIYEGNWGPADEVLAEDTEMLDV